MGSGIDRENNLNTNINENNFRHGIIFEIKNVEIGRQNRVIENYPNIQLGSIVENNIISTPGSFTLISNPFRNNHNTQQIFYFDVEDINHIYYHLKQLPISLWEY